MALSGKCPNCKEEFGLKGYDIWMKEDGVSKSESEIKALMRSIVPDKKQGIKWHSDRIPPTSPTDIEKIGHNKCRQEILRNIEEL